jgi:DNA-binding transcriptional ArsR family regulator
MPQEIRRDIFQAVADPTRREIIRYVAGEPRNVSAIAERFSITRQAVSLHVQFLKQCGVIDIEPAGRERRCRLRAEKLDEIDAWLHTIRAVWEVRFDQLDKVLAGLSTPESSKQSP